MIQAKDQPDRRKFIAVILYWSYCFLVLLHWLFSLRAHRDPLGWLSWWGSYGLEMMIPTTPISLVYNWFIVPHEPAGLVAWFGKHPDWVWVIKEWFCFAILGYFQWFYVVPFIWARIKKTPIQPAP